MCTLIDAFNATFFKSLDLFVVLLWMVLDHMTWGDRNVDRLVIVPQMTHMQDTFSMVCLYVRFYTWWSCLWADNTEWRVAYEPWYSTPLTFGCSFALVFVQDMMRNPFGMFDNMMANMRNRMGEMHRNSVSLLIQWLYVLFPFFVCVLRHKLLDKRVFVCPRRTCPRIQTPTHSAPHQSWHIQRLEMSLRRSSKQAHRHAAPLEG